MWLRTGRRRRVGTCESVERGTNGTLPPPLELQKAIVDSNQTEWVWRDGSEFLSGPQGSCPLFRFPVPAIDSDEFQPRFGPGRLFQDIAHPFSLKSGVSRAHQNAPRIFHCQACRWTDPPKQIDSTRGLTEDFRIATIGFQLAGAAPSDRTTVAARQDLTRQLTGVGGQSRLRADGHVDRRSAKGPHAVLDSWGSLRRTPICHFRSA